MTVKELIKELELYNEDLEVGYWHPEFGILTDIDIHKSTKYGEEIVIIAG